MVGALRVGGALLTTLPAHSLCSLLNFTPVRSAGCICMWYIVRISPNQSTWCQNLGTTTLRSVAKMPWGKRDGILRSRLSRWHYHPVPVPRSSVSS